MKKSVYAVKLVQKKKIIIMQKGDLSFVEKKCVQFLSHNF